MSEEMREYLRKLTDKFKAEKDDREMRARQLLRKIASVVMGFAMVSLPLTSFYASNVSLERQVDAELMSALLTGSSILFGFSTLLSINPKPLTNRRTWLLLTLALFAIVIAGFLIGDLAFGFQKDVIVALGLLVVFNINAFVTASLFGIRMRSVRKQE